MRRCNWTKGIDQKTGKPVDYEPNRDIQVYAGIAAPVPGAQTKKMCPSRSGGNNFWPSSYSAKTKLIYIPALTACGEITQDPKLSVKVGTDMRGGISKPLQRYETDFSAAHRRGEGQGSHPISKL
jgi:alcohol dehydrogenase (cytochrome c)